MPSKTDHLMPSIETSVNTPEERLPYTTDDIRPIDKNVDR